MLRWPAAGRSGPTRGGRAQDDEEKGEAQPRTGHAEQCIRPYSALRQTLPRNLRPGCGWPRPWETKSSTAKRCGPGSARMLRQPPDSGVAAVSWTAKGAEDLQGDRRGVESDGSQMSCWEGGRQAFALLRAASSARDPWEGN